MPHPSLLFIGESEPFMLPPQEPSLSTAGTVTISIRICLKTHHYSAGVGRTGTYIALDNAFNQIEAKGYVDIDGIIVEMRNQRMKMIQSKVVLWS